jgi:hypothetical protein
MGFCRRTGAGVKPAPHLRQKFAWGGLLARQRRRVQTRDVTLAVTGRGMGRPVRRLNPSHNVRQISPTIHAKKSVHPTARKAKNAKM